MSISNAIPADFGVESICLIDIGSTQLLCMELFQEIIAILFDYGKVLTFVILDVFVGMYFRIGNISVIPAPLKASSSLFVKAIISCTNGSSNLNLEKFQMPYCIKAFTANWNTSTFSPHGRLFSI